MRPIKFRAWDKEKKEWYKPTHEAYKGQLFELFVSFAGSLASHTMNGMTDESVFPDCFELMQFTGLTDKNGKEIYEGDVVKFQMTRTKLVDHPVMTAFTDETAIYQGAVKWGEFGWRPFVDGKVEECEIIGNLYENPELIKV